MAPNPQQTVSLAEPAPSPIALAATPVRELSGRRRRFGLRARATVATALATLVVSTLLAFFTFTLVRGYLLSQRETVTQREAFANARVVRDVLTGREPDVGKVLAELQVEPGSTVFLHRNGTWFANAVGLSDATISPTLREAVLAGEAGWARFSVDGKAQLGVAVPLPSINASYIEVFPMESLNRTLDVLRNALAAGLAASAIGGALVGFWASRRVLRPVAEIAAAADEISSGELATRLGADPDPDLAILAHSFNQMADSLHDRIEREARFASDVSHELRTPLSALASASRVLERRRDELPARAREAVDIVSSQLDRFQSLVLDLLEIAHLDAGVADVHVEVSSLADLTRRIVRAAGIAEGVLRVDPAAESALVAVDRRRFERILSNFLDNAENHGGGVTAVTVAEMDGRGVVGVQDDGPGVVESDRLRIFERFARGPGTSNRPGSGLGLSLAAEQARVQHGEVWVEACPSGGARFVVAVPLAGAP